MFKPPESDFFSAASLVDVDRDSRAKYLQWFLDNGWKFHNEMDGYISPKQQEAIEAFSMEMPL